jgi:hypothetical protein
MPRKAGKTAGDVKRKILPGCLRNKLNNVSIKISKQDFTWIKVDTYGRVAGLKKCKYISIEHTHFSSTFLAILYILLAFMLIYFRHKSTFSDQVIACASNTVKRLLKLLRPPSFHLYAWKN